MCTCIRFGLECLACRNAVWIADYKEKQKMCDITENKTKKTESKQYDWTKLSLSWQTDPSCTELYCNELDYALMLKSGTVRMYRANGNYSPERAHAFLTDAIAQLKQCEVTLRGEIEAVLSPLKADYRWCDYPGTFDAVFELGINRDGRGELTCAVAGRTVRLVSSPHTATLCKHAETIVALQKMGLVFE